MSAKSLAGMVSAEERIRGRRNLALMPTEEKVGCSRLTDRLKRSKLLVSIQPSSSGTYEQARQKFLAALPQARAFVLPGILGLQNDELSVDVASVGYPQAECVLVIISGTYGPRGFCRSGIQIDWLALLERSSLPENVGLLFIHGLNPYGFAWDPRVKQGGCDLNRNFVNLAASAPACYNELVAHCALAALEESSFEIARETIRQFKPADGERTFQIIQKSGQYIDPNGMFLIDRCWSTRTLDAIAREYAEVSRKFVAVIDLHTGLGPYGYGELQSEHIAASQFLAIAGRKFGPSLTSEDLGTSSSIPIRSSLQLYSEQLLGDGRYLYLCLEYGTFDTEVAHRALADQWLHIHGSGNRTGTRGREVPHACPFLSRRSILEGGGAVPRPAGVAAGVVATAANGRTRNRGVAQWRSKPRPTKRTNGRIAIKGDFQCQNE